MKLLLFHLPMFPR
uniref:Uncharacterized protein n=1 Tax=Arundo donax TaxID=35708 RepID=A0A0A8Y445_ARUDO